MQPTFEELPSDYDYQSALNIQIQADQAFQQLPAKLRDRYGNDPQLFLAALADPAEKESLQALGVLKATPAPEKAPEPPTPPPGPA